MRKELAWSLTGPCRVPGRHVGPGILIRRPQVWRGFPTPQGCSNPELRRQRGSQRRGQGLTHEGTRGEGSSRVQSGHVPILSGGPSHLWHNPPNTLKRLVSSSARLPGKGQKRGDGLSKATQLWTQACLLQPSLDFACLSLSLLQHHHQ